MISIGQNDKSECVENFCYLGDMIGSGGGSEEAAKGQSEMCECAWTKFNFDCKRGFAYSGKEKSTRLVCKVF